MANIQDINSLIQNLANLSVPELLKWMIVNITVNELNRCLNALGLQISETGTNISSPGPGPMGGTPGPPSRTPGSLSTASPRSTTTTTTLELPDQTRQGGGPSDYSALVYKIITVSRDTKLIPLVVMPNSLIYYTKFNDTKVYSATSYSDYLYDNEDSNQKKRGRKKTAVQLYKLIATNDKLKYLFQSKKVFNYQYVVPYVVGISVRDEYQNIFNVLTQNVLKYRILQGCNFKFETQDDVLFAYTLRRMALLDKSKLTEVKSQMLSNTKGGCGYTNSDFKSKFGSIQREAANHNIYLTGFRFGDSKFFSYIYDKKNMKWLQDREEKKPKGAWKSIKSLKELMNKEQKSNIKPTEKGLKNFMKLGENLTMPSKQFNYSKPEEYVQLNPIPMNQFGYIKNFPVNRAGGQLFALPSGPSAYFKGPHKGVSSTFSEDFAINHGLVRSPNHRMRVSPREYNGKNRSPSVSRPEFQFGRLRNSSKGKSCFGRTVEPNDYGKNVYNSYTRKYQPGIADNRYGYRGTQGPYGGYTGAVGFPAFSTQTLQQGLVPLRGRSRKKRRI